MRLSTTTLCSIAVSVTALFGCDRSEVAVSAPQDQAGVGEFDAEQANKVQPTTGSTPNRRDQKSVDSESTQAVGNFEISGQAAPTRRPSFSRYSGSASLLSTRAFSVGSGEMPVGSKTMIGKRLPAFSLNDIAGNTLTNETLKGKVVLLDFWATWCGPCRKASPVMQQLHDEWAERGLMVIGANTSEFDDGQIIRTPNAARAYAAEHNYTYTFTYGSDDLKAACKVTGLPAFLIVDTDGVVVDVLMSYDDTLLDILQQKIEPLLETIPVVDRSNVVEQIGNRG
ncbi:TlpA family protein disulfide reductase [Roseiconus nitratireducens]|uniref:TlpA family protein disulfide reductase n=1 Tax=Roseiconus nitratireducens TaxID=2605748 RepID=A0A5M6CKE8_9BACT|nr:TlpA disulfide reductase family protein [Roseiconus nitratireducens]KAA5535691.1 TlpA family protein disulfide reductase [Roseiconus nitratireducens]